VISFDYGLLFPTYTPPLLGGAGAKRAPSPPWDVGKKAPEPSVLLRNAMSSRPLIDLSRVKAGMPGADEDYAELFALYNGLTSLETLVARADAKGVPAYEQRQLERRFAKGMTEIGAYVDKLKLDQLRLVRGEVSERARGAAGVPRGAAQLVTEPMHRGASTDPIAGLDGPARFSITIAQPPVTTTITNADGSKSTITTTPPPPRTLDIDLSAIGPAEARTLDAVVRHLNDRMAADGASTRFERVKVPHEPRTIKVGERTVTLPAEPDRWSLKIKGVSNEVLSFAAAERADAVYLAQTAGKAATDQAEAPRREILKFQADAAVDAPSDVPQPYGEAHWVAGRSFSRVMDPDVTAVRASAAGADGSVWMLAEVTGPVSDQAIKGEQDVALLKYDSTGRLLFSRTLGAADTAKAGAIAISADGRVAIGGAVRGVLRDAPSTTLNIPGVQPSTDSLSLNGAEDDSFVSVYDAEGVELWTRRGGAYGEDEIKALTFGADGAVYAAGRSRGTMPGGTEAGGQDAWVRGYDAAGALSFTRQFGGTGTDAATALAVEGSILVTAGVEDGQAVLRSWDLAAAGGPSLTATRNLGGLNGGSVAGVALEGGRVTVAGTTASGSLSAGAVNAAFTGGRDAFVASLDATLAAGAADRITYWGGTGEEDVAAVALKDGQAWITGSSSAPVGADALIGTQDGFLARIDAETGAIGFSRRFSAKDGVAAPSAIAVAEGGASVLDRLGLPTGAVDYTGAQEIAAATAARAGDRFYVKTGSGRPQAVTLEAGDTLQTLAVKVNRALGFNARATVVKNGDFDALEIKPRSSRSNVTLISGETGRDLLASLGLADGVVQLLERDRKGKEIKPDDGKLYGLKLARDLSLDSKAEIKRAGDELNSAKTVIRTAYRDLADALKPKTGPQIPSGPVPAYLQAQMANYQAGLSRLGG